MNRDTDPTVRGHHVVTQDLGEDKRPTPSTSGDQIQLFDNVPLRLYAHDLNSEYEDGFKDFFRKEYSRIVKVMMYVGATFEEAEDAVSPAMAQAYTRWPLLTQPAAWVRRVALHNYFKKTKKDRSRSHAETAASRLDCSDRGLGSEHVDPDEHSRVIAVLRRLPPAQLTVMALTFDGYTPTEIAQMLHQDAKTVRSNLRHARKRLQNEFENLLSRQTVVAGKGEGDQG